MCVKVITPVVSMYGFRTPLDLVYNRQFYAKSRERIPIFSVCCAVGVITIIVLHLN